LTELEYWKECIADAACECELRMTQEQIEYMAGAVQGTHENYGLAFYQPESPYPAEIKKLNEQIAREKSKVVCPKCKGKGELISNGPYHCSISACWKCNGEGKVLPENL
jgi:RecJ-like exonuclease